ncbi:MAG: hypothetical protein CVU61_07800 [Deltaproteobacteria bacterium HGW-Deltaproteobacteria-19]|jgi:hypothetical protein|nr:MAG: hypothetical protein CVU61_07800 [Deltaproteobacteria bacterium HGW-Deltaproteobacteria-19]
MSQPEDSFEIRLMQPEDADGTVALYRATYGDAYPIREIYDPQALLRQQETGAMYHVVCMTKDGLVAGHWGLYRTSAPFPSLYEAGHGMVLPEFRNRGLNDRIARYTLETLIPRLGIPAVWGEAVANHLFMQKTCAVAGYSETGIELDLMPAASYEKEKSASGRVGAVLMFRLYQTRGQTIRLPDPYAGILRELHREAHDAPHVYRNALPYAPPEGPSEVQSVAFEGANLARLTIREIGSDLSQILRGKEADLTGDGATVFQVYLRLTDPAVGFAVRTLRELGYFFGGVLPRWFDDDGLMMQKTLHEPNVPGLRLHSDKAKMILDFILRDRAEVTAS